VNFIVESKIENPMIEKANKNLEEDLNEGMD
jgi:hypothetical protein